VPSNDFRDPEMNNIRSRMVNAGIPINDERNGWWAPNTSDKRMPGDMATAHKGEGAHSDVFKEWVKNELRNARTAREFEIGLRNLRRQLLRGITFHTQKDMQALKRGC
jgi:hypothetical protein